MNNTNAFFSKIIVAIMLLLLLTSCAWIFPEDKVRCEEYDLLDEKSMAFFKYQLNDTHFFYDKYNNSYFLVYESSKDSDIVWGIDASYYNDCENSLVYHHYGYKIFFLSTNIPFYDTIIDNTISIECFKNSDTRIIIGTATNIYLFSYMGRTNTIYADTSINESTFKINELNGLNTFIYYNMINGIDLIYNGKDTLYHE